VLSLRQLKVFESVARLRGVLRAARECHLSQPAVTQAIASLERQLGTTLLDRRANGSHLNEAGIILQRRVQRLLERVEAALIQVGVPSGSLSIANVACRVTRPQIKALIAIAETGSFASAAKRLGVSHSSLQRTARDLERTLHAPLYLQGATGVLPNPCAIELARRMKLAWRELQSGIEEISEARGQPAGEIVIGAMLMAGNSVLAAALDEFATRYPLGHVRVQNGNAQDLLKSLQNGELDMVVGLLRQPATEDLAQWALGSTPFVVAARPGHPLFRQSEISLADIARCEWVIGTPGATRRSHFERLFAGLQRPQARIETCSLPMIHQLLMYSDRLTLLTTFEMSCDEGLLAALPFGPVEPAPTIGLTMRRDWLPTALQASFLKLFGERHVGGAVSQPMVELPLESLGRGSQTTLPRPA
jgi:DNA-binding transcriptional LysR family regulator